MATITTGASGNWSDADGVGAWTGTTKPDPGDAVIVADGHVLVLDEDASILSLTAAGNTGYCTCAVNVTLTITGTGIAYAGTLAAGFIRVTANTLTITSAQGGATVLVTASAAGYAVLGSGSGSITLSNSGGYAWENTSSGRAVSATGTGGVSITGTGKHSGSGYGAFVTASGAHVLAGSLESSVATAAYYMGGGTLTWSSGSVTLTAAGQYGLWCAGGVVNITGSPTTSETSSVVAGVAILIGGSTVNFTGSKTLAASTELSIRLVSGVLNLVLQGSPFTPLALANSGSFEIRKIGGTLNTADAGAGAASIINQTATSYAAILGGTDAQKGIIAGPVIPLATHVYPKGLGLAFGYAGAPVLGTLRASNIGTLSEVASSEDLVAGDLADGVIVDDVTGTLAGGGGYTWGDSVDQGKVLTTATGAGTYHAPDAAEVISTAVFGPASGTPGTYDVSDVAEGNIIVGASIGGVAGVYPLTATTQAADAAILEAEKAYLLATKTITFGASSVVGTLAVSNVLTAVTGGTFDATNLSVGNVIQDVTFGVGLTGTGANLLATHTTYLSLEASRNSTTAAAAQILTGYSVTIAGSTTNGTYVPIAQANARKTGAGYYGAGGAVDGTCYVPGAADVRKTVAVDATTGTLVGIVDSAGTLYAYGTCSAAQARTAAGIVHDSGTVNAYGTLTAASVYAASGILHSLGTYNAHGIYDGDTYFANGVFDNATTTRYTLAYATEAAGGTYHESEVGEVKDGVFFGAGSLLEGTYSPGGTYAEGVVDGAGAQLILDQNDVAAVAGSILTTVTGLLGTVDGTYVAPVQAGYSALAAGYGDGGLTTGTLAAAKIHDATYGTLADGSVLVAAGGTYIDPADVDVRKTVAVGVSPRAGTLVGCIDSAGVLQGVSGVMSLTSSYTATGHFDGTTVTAIGLWTLISGVAGTEDVREGTPRYSGGGNGALIVPNPSDVRLNVETDNTTGTLIGVVDNTGVWHAYGTCDNSKVWAASGIIHTDGTAAASGILTSGGGYYATGILVSATSYYSYGTFSAAGAYNATGVIYGTGSYATEASRNVDPGEAYVLTGHDYTILGAAKSASYSPDFPAVENVLTIDTVNGSSGTFSEAARNTDPGEANVADGVSYKILNVDKEGTLVGGDYATGYADGKAYIVAGLVLPTTYLVDAPTMYGVNLAGYEAYYLEGTGLNQATLTAALSAAGLTLPTGTYACTWTVNDGTTALQGATVSFWLAGVLRGTGTTNASGTVPMSFDAGTYTVAISLSGYTFANTTHTVSSTASTWTKTFSMTAIAITPPTSPTDCACAWLCLDDSDVAVAGVVIRARPDTDVTGTGYAWSGKTRSATSVAGTGLATINLPQGSKWWIRRDSGTEELFTVPATTTTTTVVSVRGGKRDTY